jgi:phosphoribosyl-ATP pyrophosphohydrolase
MNILYKYIQKIIKERYVHRKGFIIADIPISKIFDHLDDEIVELYYALNFESEDHQKNEMGDVLAILYHIMVKKGWSVGDIEATACLKLGERFNSNGD